MVLLNIQIFDFSPPKIYNEIIPYFLVNSCLTYKFFNENFQKWVENYDNIFQKKLDSF